jgi:hypothetical protein
MNLKILLVVVAALAVFAGFVYVVGGSMFSDQYTAYSTGMKIPSDGNQSFQILTVSNAINSSGESPLKIAGIDPGYDFYGFGETANGSIEIYNSADHWVNSTDVLLVVKKQRPSSGLPNYETILSKLIHFDDQIPPGEHYTKEFSYDVPRRVGNEDALGFWVIEADLTAEGVTTHAAVHIEYNIVPAVQYI